MSGESETDDLHENGGTIEEKRRKNVIDNQKFLRDLKLVKARDELKSTVNSITTMNKSPRKKRILKKKLPIEEIRRSSRIQSRPQNDYTNQFTLDDDGSVIVSNDETSDEDADLLTAFTTKIDADWMPLSLKKISVVKKSQPPRKAAKPVYGGVKIFLPNIGLQAAKMISKDNLRKLHVSKKMNVAISSSSEDEEN